MRERDVRRQVQIRAPALMADKPTLRILADTPVHPRPDRPQTLTPHYPTEITQTALDADEGGHLSSGQVSALAGLSGAHRAVNVLPHCLNLFSHGLAPGPFLLGRGRGPYLSVLDDHVPVGGEELVVFAGQADGGLNEGFAQALDLVAGGLVPPDDSTIASPRTIVQAKHERGALLA